MIVPVQLYADKTGVDVFQRYGVEPLMFTFLTIKRHLRNKAEAWRLLGFLPDLNLKSSATQKRERDSTYGKSRSVRNYHRCLSNILESFIENQGFDKPVYGHFRLGPYIQRVRLFFPLASVLGDALSGDHFCARYQSYIGVCRISRACDRRPEDADDLERDCDMLAMDEFQKDAVLALKLMGIAEFDDDDSVPPDENAKLKEIEERFQKNCSTL